MVYTSLHIVIIFLVKEVISTNKRGTESGLRDFVHAGDITRDILLGSALIAFLRLGMALIIICRFID